MTTNISHCNFKIDGKHNKHSFRAVEAVAEAAAANARAIEALAKSIQVNYGNACCVKVEGTHGQ